MSSNTAADSSVPLTANVTVPQHVVYRSFPAETVMLNLQTGKYHGLNATAGRMLDALERAPCIRDAAATLSADYDQPHSVIEADLRSLCDALLQRGLLEADVDSKR